MSTQFPSPGFAIAIDGPVAAGKGTIANALANELHAFNFDTGSMYRALALFVLRKGIKIPDFEDTTNYDALIPQVLQVLEEIQIDVKDTNTIFINGENVTEEIRNEKVTNSTPHVAAIPQVRQEMVKRQRALIYQRIQSGQIVIVDARDAGTVIIPDVIDKYYIWAETEIRAQRRWAQFGRDNGRSQEEVLEEIQIRDKTDEERAASPLLTKEEAQNQGYMIIDTSHTPVESAVAKVIADLRSKHDTH